MINILRVWQGLLEVLLKSLAWAVGDVCSDFYMTKGKNVKYFKITLDNIVDYNPKFISQENIIMLL